MKIGVRSKKAAIVRAKRWRSVTDSTSIRIFGEASKSSLDTLSAEGREPFVFPEVAFLALTVNCDYAVEGWLILPIADLSPALRF